MKLAMTLTSKFEGVMNYIMLPKFHQGAIVHAVFVSVVSV